MLVVVSVRRVKGGTYSHEDVLPKCVCSDLLLSCILIHLWHAVLLFGLHGRDAADVHGEEAVCCFDAWALDVGIPCIL